MTGAALRPSWLTSNQKSLLLATPLEESRSPEDLGDVILANDSETTASPALRNWWIAMFFAASIMSLVHVVHFAGNPKFYFLPATLVISVYLVIRDWNRVFNFPSARTSQGLILASTVTLLLAITWGMPWFAGLSLVLAFAAFCHSHVDRENKPITRLVVPAIFLLPLPQVVDAWLTNFAQAILSVLASTLLDLANVTHRIVSGTCNFPFGIADISNISQGINSIQAVAFAATSLCIWMGRSTLLVPLYLVSAFVVTALTNLGQLITYQMIGASTSFAMAESLSGSVLGLLGLACSVLLLISFDRLIYILFSPTADKSSGTSPYNPITETWDFVFGRKQFGSIKSRGRLVAATVQQPSRFLVTSVVAMLTTVPIQVVQCYKVLSNYQFVERDLVTFNKSALASLPEDWSMTELGNRVDYEPPVLADRAFQWTLGNADMTIRLALAENNPLHHWQSNANRLGWKVEPQQSHNQEDSGSMPAQTYDLSRDNRRFMLLQVGLQRQFRIGLVDSNESNWLKVLKSEIEHEKRFQLRLATTSPIKKDSVQISLQETIRKLSRQIEIATNLTTQEKQ